MKNYNDITDDETLVLNTLKGILDNDKEPPTASKISKRTPFTTHYVRSMLVSLKKRNLISYYGSDEATRVHTVL